MFNFTRGPTERSELFSSGPFTGRRRERHRIRDQAFSSHQLHPLTNCSRPLRSHLTVAFFLLLVLFLMTASHLSKKSLMQQLNSISVCLCLLLLITETAFLISLYLFFPMTFNSSRGIYQDISPAEPVYFPLNHCIKDFFYCLCLCIISAVLK